MIGCAYSTSGGLPPELTRVRVGLVRNETTVRGAASELTAELVNALSREPRLRDDGKLAVPQFEDALAFCRKGYRPELAWTCCDYADTLLKHFNPGAAASWTSDSWES